MKLKPTIYVALTDDWELRGNGSGEMERLQFAPMREMVRIYQRHGVSASFNAEPMQQLAFRKFQDRNPELRALADCWDDHVRATFRQGHDIQLHVHPQWSGAQYVDGGWRLSGDWSLLNYDEAAAYGMLAAGKEYLEQLLQSVNPNYKCVAFRAGAWCIAPSMHLLRSLARLGIVLDTSIVGGLRQETRHLQLDYRDCEETFLPFYPVMEDARKVSDKREAIICVPTQHFYTSRRHVFRHHLSKVGHKLKARTASSKNTVAAVAVPADAQDWAEVSSPLARLYEKSLMPYLKGNHLVSDIAPLSYELLREMIESIRARTRATGLRELPVILTNHTKDIQDFTAIERFIGEASQADDIKFVTLTGLADGLREGKFQVRKR